MALSVGFKKLPTRFGTNVARIWKLVVLFQVRPTFPVLQAPGVRLSLAVSPTRPPRVHR
jgi:hypothetical protein